MNRSQLDENTLKLLVYQLNTYRIPRIKRMLERIDKGEKLGDEDIQHLKREYDESMKDWRLVERNPKYLNLALRYVELYTHVVSRALENQEAPVKQG